MYVTMLPEKKRRKRLTKHFDYSEMTKTSTGLDNDPDDYAFTNLLYTCRILESVRKKFGSPLNINSAFRSVAVNNLVSGSKNSYHLDGRAVDISTSSLSQSEIDRLENILSDYNPVELIRYYTKPIIHVAF